MRRLWKLCVLTLSVAPLLAAPVAVSADDDDDEPAALAFQSVMIGLGEVPPVASTGRGVASYLITGNSATLYYTLQVLDVSSPITAAHIHLGASGQNGEIVVNPCGAGSAPASAPEGVVATGAVTPSS